MKSKVFLLVIIFAFLFCFSYVSAEVPKMINYQGKITTSTGLLIDATLSMVFTIYDDSTGGTVFWTETQDSVKIEKGVFSVLLGSVNSIPDSVFDGSVRYLGLTVGNDPEMTPRKAIVNVGYAYHSEIADTAKFAMPDADWTIVGDTIYHLNGNVGIGTTNPTSVLHLSKSDGSTELTIARADNGNYHASTCYSPAEPLSNSNKLWESGLHLGRNNYEIWAWDGYSETLGLSIKNDGNVGIGTTNPSGKLEVVGSTYLDGHTWVNGILALGDNQDAGIAKFGTQGLGFRVGNVADKVVIDNSGNVGIGTDQPNEKLHVIGNISLPDGNVIGRVPTDAFTYDGKSMGHYALGWFNDSWDGAGPTAWFSGYSGFKLFTRGTPKFAITGGGNVGIGTTSPTRTLMVAGDGDFNGSDPAEQVRVENWSTGTNADGIFARTHSLDGGAGLSADAIEMTDGNTFGVLGVTKAYSTRANPSDPNKSSGCAAGVYGWAAYTGEAGDVFGVLGVFDGIGGFGPGPNSAAGVYGLCTKDTGRNYGVFGETKSRNTDVAGVYGIGNNTDGRVHGVLGLTQSDEQGSAGVFGVAQASTGVTYGVYGRSNSASGYGGYFDGGLHCINGDITVENGSKLAVVPTSFGMRGLYCQESPEVWFEDFGEGELKEGHAHIELDDLFLETVTISEEYPMKVFVQLNDDCKGVYVKRGMTRFDVYELDNGKSNAHFTYRIVAKRKGFEDKRLEKVEQELTSK